MQNGWNAKSMLDRIAAVAYRATMKPNVARNASRNFVRNRNSNCARSVASCAEGRRLG